jgi:hypothetical protein
MNHLVQQKYTGRLYVEAGGVSQASPDIVWGLLADVRKYCRWGPWRASDYGYPGEGARGDDALGGAGAIRWLRYGRRTTTVERICVAEPGRRMEYTVVKGLPVRGYLAEVTLTAAGSGTSIHWSASWERTLGGRLVHRKLVSLYPEVVRSLIAAADEIAAPVPA